MKKTSPLIAAMKIKFPTILLLTLFLWACARKQHTNRFNEPIHAIDLAKTSIKKSFPYSTIYSGVQIIPIDSTILIGSINKMDVYKDKLVILDANLSKAIFILSKQGQLIRKIGNIGSGPKEYTDCSDFAIDKQSGIIYVFDKRKNEMVLYDMDTGKYCRTLKLERKSELNRIWINSGKLYAINSYYQFREKDQHAPYYILQQIDTTTGKKVGQWLDAAWYNKGYKENLLHVNFFYPVSDNMDLFTFGISDTIMCIRNGELSPYIAFNGDLQIKPEDISETERTAVKLPVKERSKVKHNLMLRLGRDLKKVISFSNFHYHKGVLYFNYSTWPRFFASYNLETNEAQTYAMEQDDMLFLEDPSERILPHYLYADGEGVYYFIKTDYLYQLKEWAKQKVLSNHVVGQETLFHVTEDSNPIILYYKYVE
ncbi:MAG: 6-bladed beta-propeller [Prevotellaceae bacterium]|jgi:hypothetical protein|nr:6-bladed beta-propeller [Prevotellaceae bacterium]